MKKKVFIYVGHSNWGKSMALKLLTGNNTRIKNTTISNQHVKVRKMSNDDDGKKLLEHVKEIPRIYCDRFIIAFCPNYPPVTGIPTPEQVIGLDIIIELQRTNDLFFFVQQEKFKDSTQQISQDEINWLSIYGTVHVLKGQNDNIIRASEFENFIKLNI